MEERHWVNDLVHEFVAQSCLSPFERDRTFLCVFDFQVLKIDTHGSYRCLNGRLEETRSSVLWTVFFSSSVLLLFELCFESVAQVFLCTWTHIRFALSFWMSVLSPPKYFLVGFVQQRARAGMFVKFLKITSGRGCRGQAPHERDAARALEVLVGLRRYERRQR